MKIFRIEDFIKDGLSLGIFKSTDSTPYGEHTHEFTEIIYVLDGEVEERINDTEYRMTRGDLLFINYGSTHSFSPIGSVTFLNISFSPEVMGRRIISRENAFDLLSLTAFDEISNGKGEGVVLVEGGPAVAVGLEVGEPGDGVLEFGVFAFFLLEHKPSP